LRRDGEGGVEQHQDARLDLDDIQGDVLVGLHKNAELFVFFRISEAADFKRRLRQHVIARLTSTRQTIERRSLVTERRRSGGARGDISAGINLGFTRHGMTQLLGPRRAALDPAFERGSADPDTITRLNDPPPSRWLPAFIAERVDGVLLIAGPDERLVRHQGDLLLTILGPSVKPVYSELGQVRPGRQRGHEHFGFRDGISQPGIRGLTRPTRPRSAPDQGLPGQDLVWPGEFVFGYPGQDPRNAGRAGAAVPLPAPWARNGSFMVYRRLEQLVPEFHAFVAAEAGRLGLDKELLAARLVGRWASGAPLERAPLHDDAALAGDPMRNNDFDYRDDPYQRRCPYAAHIRKAYPRDDPAGGEAETQRHRIMRAGIPFGPEVMPGETRTLHPRGLLFVCYQIAIERQFEFIQRRFADEPGFVEGKRRPDDGNPVTPGYDPIIGQAPGEGPRVMDEPAPNYPAGNRRSSLTLPQQFVRLTAAGYFFMPSLSALRTALT
jgi:Dyp-type peroxidase family